MRLGPICDEVKLEMVGAQRFELWTSWSRTINLPGIYHLAVGATVVSRYQRLRVIKGFASLLRRQRATVRNTEIRGVRTKMGTVRDKPSRQYICVNGHRGLAHKPCTMIETRHSSAAEKIPGDSDAATLNVEIEIEDPRQPFRDPARALHHRDCAH